MIPLAIYTILYHRRKSIYFMVPTVILSAGGAIVLNAIHNGWYNFYLFYLPRAHETDLSMITGFWAKDVLSVIPIMMMLSTFYLYSEFKNNRRNTAIFYLFVLLGMLGGSWFGRIHTGGYLNVLIPAMAAFSIVTGLAVDLTNRVLGKYRSIALLSLVILIPTQFLMLRYNPDDIIPGNRDLAAGMDLIDKISAVEGKVLMPYHGYYNHLAGKKTFAHKMAIGDVQRGDSVIGRELSKEISEALRNQKFDALFLDARWFPDTVLTYYTSTGFIFEQKDVFFPVTGFNVRPKYYFIPRDSL